MRVPDRFFGIRDLAYFKAGIRFLKEKGDEIRDCNYDRDTGFGDFNRRESGIVALLKETEIREFQRLKYAKKIKLSS